MIQQAKILPAKHQAEVQRHKKEYQASSEPVTACCLIEVKAHSLMFRFFRGMPPPDEGQVRFRRSENLGIGQEKVPKNGSVVLVATDDGEPC